jgi:hypothetical protein
MPWSIRLAFVALTSLAVTGSASAQGDYDPRADAWNGLGQLVRIAEDSGAIVEIPDRLDVGTLRPDDALLVVYPTRDLPVAGLAGFLRAGGRLALADDYGNGRELLNLYRISRQDSTSVDAPRLRGNEDLLVAAPGDPHILTDGVSAVVANHPQTVYHAELQPILAFGSRPGNAVVLAGAVGEGRLVAIADPSMLINNMLQFRGNRRFAANLASYLTEGRSGKLVIITGDTPMVGRFGELGADRPLHDLRSLLESISRRPLPPALLQLGAFGIAAILIAFAATALPRRSPYEGRAMFARQAIAGGFWGRVAFFRDRSADLLQPLMVYKFELEGEIVRRLGLTGRTLLRDVLGAMRKRGMNETDVGEMKAILLELDDLRERQDRPPAPPRVSPRQLHEIVAASERLLTKMTPPGAEGAR